MLLKFNCLDWHLHVFSAHFIFIIFFFYMSFFPNMKQNNNKMGKNVFCREFFVYVC